MWRWVVDEMGGVLFVSALERREARPNPMAEEAGNLRRRAGIADGTQP